MIPFCCCQKQKDKDNLRKNLLIKNNVCPHCLARFNTISDKNTHMKHCIYRPIDNHFTL